MSRKRRGVPSAGQSLSARVRQLNRWRDNFNPARGLTMARAGWLVEAAMRGEWADFQWAFMAPVAGIECADADLLALIECRTSALLEMDWNVKVVEGSAGAEAQAGAVREMLDGIGNLYEAIEHLAMASFRGYAHCEKIYGDGNLLELRVVPQYRLVREGGAGRWKYNAGDLSVGFAGLDDSWLVEPVGWVIREVPRFVNRVALTKYIRSNLSQRDWDAFIEIYGIPGGIVIGPPDVPPDREGTYAAAAEAAATSGHAYLPHGSSYAANDGPRGTNPFAEHMRFLSEQLVLAGTGGKLTMLAESGSGTLAGGAHLETFRRIARGEARKIGEIIQRQVVVPFLEERFPGSEELAYFELAFREEVESGQIVKDAVSLAGAGYRMDVEELSEKTGYVLETKDEGGDLKLEDEGSGRDLEERLRAVAEADDEGLEEAVAVLNREFPAVGAVLGGNGLKDEKIL